MSEATKRAHKRLRDGQRWRAFLQLRERFAYDGNPLEEAHALAQSDAAKRKLKAVAPEPAEECKVQDADNETSVSKPLDQAETVASEQPANEPVAETVRDELGELVDRNFGLSTDNQP